jgi:hypothetical protein
MSDERPLEDIEALDDWDDDDRRPASPRRSSTWLLGPIALVAVVAIVIAVVVGGTKPNAVSPVTPSPSTSTGPATLPAPTLSPTATMSQTPTQTASRVAIQLSALASDDPAEPLRISLLDPKPQAPSAGLIAYRVQICVSDRSAGVSSDKVRVAASNWQLARFESGDNPQPGVPSVAPQFPSETFLGKGECASGYVTFAWNVVEAPNALLYSDKRFGWYWRLS